MAYDFSQIFDLARLRRAWGDKSDTSAPAEKSFSPPAPAAPPLEIIAQLEDAIAEEFPDAEQRALMRHTLDAIRALFTPGAAVPTAANTAELKRLFDELEDLIDAFALSVPA